MFGSRHSSEGDGAAARDVGGSHKESVGILQRAKATSANHYGGAGVTVESSDEFSGWSDSDAAGCNEVWVYFLCVEYVAAEQTTQEGGRDRKNSQQLAWGSKIATW